MIALLLLACGNPCSYTCPDEEPVPAGVHAIAGIDRDEVVEGTVTIGADETVTIEYLDHHGRTIRVRYRRAE